MRLARLAPLGPRFSFEETWNFAVAPDRFWTLVSDVGSYRSWWPALRSLRGEGLVDGARSRAVIAGPLPYRLRLDFVVASVTPAARVEVSVSGDADGKASLDIVPGPDGTSTVARLVWEVQLRRVSLRLLSFLVHPLMAWAHNRVIRQAVRQFRARAF